MSRPRPFHGLIFLAFALAGCVSTQSDEKVQFYNDDGVTMFNRGDYRSARESFEMALELAPQNPDLLFNLGECHDRMGSFQRAEQYYVQCLQLASGHKEARYSLGMLYYNTGRKAEAVKLIEEWLTNQPNQANAYALDGWRYRVEQNYPNAQGRFQQALGLEGRNVHALTEMGILFETMGMPERALALYERSLESNPNQGEVVQRLAQLKARNVGRPLPD